MERSLLSMREAVFTMVFDRNVTVDVAFEIVVGGLPASERRSGAKKLRAYLDAEAGEEKAAKKESDLQLPLFPPGRADRENARFSLMP